MLDQLAWEYIRAQAFTRIRWNFTLEVLERLALEDDNYTPVSGDVLAEVWYE